MNPLMEKFHKLSKEERLQRIKKYCRLTEADLMALSGKKSLSPEMAENFIENVVGCFPMPLGVATYFKIDGKDIFIPMAVEESSIIAAASATAKWIYKEGSIRTYSKGHLAIGQIQFPSIVDINRFRKVIQIHRNLLVDVANDTMQGLVRRGGGVQDISVRELGNPDGSADTNEQMVVCHILCDPCDAMGANLINQACEAVKPVIEKLTGEKVGICILSNLVDSRLVGAEVVIRNVDPKIGKGIEEASRFAKMDPYRACTHNKGTLNGIDPILIATGNDWRAVEAGIHAYACRSGKYSPITDWWMENGDLKGKFEAPMSVGIVGGVTRSHPTARVALKIMGIKSSDDLGRICGAVGLVQNLGALKALSTVGIVEGHMKLHAANLAIAAGAEISEIGLVRDRLAQVLKKEKKINLTRAKEVLEDLRGHV